MVILDNDAFIYCPNRRESIIERVSLVSGEVQEQFLLNEDKLID